MRPPRRAPLSVAHATSFASLLFSRLVKGVHQDKHQPRRRRSQFFASTRAREAPPAGSNYKGGGAHYLVALQLVGLHLHSGHSSSSSKRHSIQGASLVQLAPLIAYSSGGSHRCLNNAETQATISISRAQDEKSIGCSFEFIRRAFEEKAAASFQSQDARQQQQRLHLTLSRSALNFSLSLSLSLSQRSISQRATTKRQQEERAQKTIT